MFAHVCERALDVKYIILKHESDSNDTCTSLITNVYTIRQHAEYQQE